jgi:guanine deaminase
MYETRFMHRVLELSRRGMTNGHGGPFGCVIVKDGEIVGEAHNEVLSSNDPTAHAELLAVRRASAKLKTFNLGGCELYTNGAPCCMCMSSMLWSRIDRAYYVSQWTNPAPSALAMSRFTRSWPDRSISVRSSP